MSFNVLVGEPLILRLTLPEQDDSKYIRAIVKDDNGVALTGSPFILQNIGDGEYFFKDANNLLFPDGRLEVVAIYQIFDDAGFTTPTVEYGYQTQDVFRSLDLGIDLEQVAETIDKLDRVTTQALLLRDDIDVIIEDEEPIEVVIADEN